MSCQQRLFHKHTIVECESNSEEHRFSLLLTREIRFSAQGSDWPTNYATCGKTKQSPINIENGECDPALNKSITFTKYDNAGTKEFTLKNNGHSVVLSTSSTGASIKLKDVGTFNLLQVHFHWGSDNTKGSEHTLMGKAYPAEVRTIS
jgi:carbonic anhydrase